FQLGRGRHQHRAAPEGRLRRRGADAELGGGDEPAAPGCDAARRRVARAGPARSEEHTSELQSQSNLVCRLLLEKKKKINQTNQKGGMDDMLMAILHEGEFEYIARHVVGVLSIC